MASVRRETTISAAPEVVWDALRDWGAVHVRLAPGFVVGCELDGEDRVVTFSGGAVARELFVDCDERERRLVWSARGGSLGLEHHNASAQVLADGDGRARFVWVADLLPHRAAGAVGELMDRAMATIKTTLEGAGRG